MSNFQNAVAIIAKQEGKFMELVKAASTDVVFKQEMLYASQAMMNNDFLCSTAIKNPLSLRNAFSQVAACGLTLNPARGLCYLVPRDGQVILDVSYKGMIKTAVNDGAIRDCIVELVYSNDKFVYKGGSRCRWLGLTLRSTWAKTQCSSQMPSAVFCASWPSCWRARR